MTVITITSIIVTMTVITITSIIVTMTVITIIIIIVTMTVITITSIIVTQMARVLGLVQSGPVKIRPWGTLDEVLGR